MPADPEILIDYVLKHFHDHQVAITYEAGCCGFSAARAFLNLDVGSPIIRPEELELPITDY
jgi:transposase